MPFATHARITLIAIALLISSASSVQAQQAKTQPINNPPTQVQPWLQSQVMDLRERLVRFEEKLKNVQAKASDIQATEKELALVKEKLAAIETKFDSQNQVHEGLKERLADVGLYTNMWGSAFAIFGLILTVGAVLLGFSAKNRAIKEAKDAAKIYFDKERESITNEENARLEKEREKLLAAETEKFDGLL